MSRLRLLKISATKLLKVEKVGKSDPYASLQFQGNFFHRYRFSFCLFEINKLIYILPVTTRLWLLERTLAQFLWSFSPLSFRFCSGESALKMSILYLKYEAFEVISAHFKAKGTREEKNSCREIFLSGPEFRLRVGQVELCLTNVFLLFFY